LLARERRDRPWRSEGLDHLMPELSMVAPISWIMGVTHYHCRYWQAAAVALTPVRCEVANLDHSDSPGGIVERVPTHREQSFNSSSRSR
jgi:hypothetical protein